MIGDVGLGDVEAVHLGSDARCECGDVVALGLADAVRRVSGRVRGDDLGVGQSLPEVPVALGGRDRNRQDLPHRVEGAPRLDEQAVLDVDHGLADDQQLVVERERVLREVDHPLDRVLDRDEPGIDLAGLDRVEHVGHGPIRHVLGIHRRLDAEQGLLGEGSERTEEADPSSGSRRAVVRQSSAIEATQ